MNKLFGLAILFIVLASVLNSFNLVFLPSDILSYFPSYASENIPKPHNSLLADPIFQFEPWRIFAKESFLNSELPIWNELNAGGVPFLANMQNAAFFPINFIYYALPPSISLFLIASCKYTLFLFFTFKYLKSLKLGNRESVIGSILAGAGYMIVWVQWPQTNVFLFLPLLLLVFEKLAKKKQLLFLALSLIYFVAILGGHPETLFNLFVATSLYIYVSSKNNYALLINLTAFVAGCFLGAFLTFPFVEYLINSYALISRTIQHQSVLPPASIFSVPFPLALGGPQFSLYKPFAPWTNFSETSAGSVGLIALIVIVILRKQLGKYKHLFILVAIFIFLSFLGGYIFNFFKIPVLSVNANQRFVAIAAFFIAVLAAVSISKLESFFEQVNLKINITLALLATGFLSICFIPFGTNVEKFLLFAIGYFSFVFFTTLLFFYTLKTKVSYKTAFLIIIVLLQILMPVVSFNWFTKVRNYYPRSRMVEKIKNYPNHRVLQIGNINLPADINLAYGIESAENYDALDVGSYRTAFDNSFPEKNHMGLVDQVNIDSLRKFGIGMVISDYDLNSAKIKLQTKKDNRITLDKKISLNFSNKDGVLSGVRILTENFNRNNVCTINFKLLDSENNEIFSSDVDCKKVGDNMFYTIPVKNVNLVKDKKYEIVLIPKGTDMNNFIAIRGDNLNRPYLELVIKNPIPTYEEIYSQPNLKVFKVRNSNKIESSVSYHVIEETPTQIKFITNSEMGGYMIVKNTYYPGWELYINNKKSDILGKNPFIHIQVPKGESFIRLSYTPYSFIVGLVFSVFSFLCFGIFGLRIFYTRNYLKIIKILKSVESILKSYSSIELAALFLIGSTVAAAVLTLYFLTNPVHFEVPNTTAVNWFTVNHYPRQQDYFFVFSYFIATLIGGVSSWILLLWTKLKL